MKLQATTVVIVLILATGRDAVAMPTVDHCLLKFEESLKETMTLMRSCEEANLKDCCQIAEASKIISNDNFTLPTGIYDISNVCQATSPFTLDVFPPMQARCNMDSNDGGWTVLIRRTPDVDKREKFKREWADYENGFGNLTGEFWYGLKNMHCLTSRESMEVEVEVSKTDGTKLVLRYGSFRVDGPSTSYTLYVSDKQHDEFDFLAYYHNGQKFSTTDRDNDRAITNCADNNGGWWLNACYYTYLTENSCPMLYNRGTNTFIPFDYAELRVRPKTCTGLRDNPDTCK